MACSDYNGDFLEALLSEEFRDAVLCPYQEAMGGPLFALVIYSSILSHIYIRTESVLIPVVLSILTGGIASAYVSPIGTQVLTFLLLFVGGVVPVMVIKRLLNR